MGIKRQTQHLLEVYEELLRHRELYLSSGLAQTLSRLPNDQRDYWEERLARAQQNS